MITIHNQQILDRVSCTDKYDLIRKMVDTLKFSDYSENDCASIVEKVFEREMVMSTALGFGVAIPHAKTTMVNQAHLVIARLSNEIDFDAMDNIGVDLVFLVISPVNAHKEHIKVISRISRVLNNPGSLQQIRELTPFSKIKDLIIEQL